MNKLVELKKEELMLIEGGNWLRIFRALAGFLTLAEAAAINEACLDCLGPDTSTREWLHSIN